MCDQSALPIKARYKSAPVSQLIESLMGGGRLLFEKNADFVSLNVHDQSVLLHGKLKYVGGLSTCFTLSSVGLYDNVAFCQTNELIFGPAVLAGSKRVCKQIDSDIVFVKLALTILLFSTFDYTAYTNSAANCLHDVKAVLRIQDAYVELAWRYLLHKYDHRRAVLCFSDLIRCIFTSNDAVVEAGMREQYTRIVDVLVQQTEASLSLIV